MTQVARQPNARPELPLAEKFLLDLPSKADKKKKLINPLPGEAENS